MLIYATIVISLTLELYTISVWSEKIQHDLKRWHVYMFWLALLFDIIGIALMSYISDSNLFNLSFHGISGVTTVTLMSIHAVWATIVRVKGDAAKRKNFTKYSVFVWFVWLIPFISGGIISMVLY